jgi:hypothetical protein
MFRDPLTHATCGLPGAPNATKASQARFDPAFNTLKNRITMPSPSAVATTTVAALRKLPAFTRATSGDAAKLEAQAVSIDGYLLGVKQESAETPNCGADDVDGIDYHMWLVDPADANNGRGVSAVVEATPRWRLANEAWSCETLSDLIERGAHFRITGWRLFDYEHPGNMKATTRGPATRGTLWEIHPITKIQVDTSAGWLELGAPKLLTADLLNTRTGKNFSEHCKHA